jgi:hypothetical protein
LRKLTLALLVLLPASALAQPTAKLKLQIFDPFEPDRRVTIVGNPAPGLELILNQRDPRATGRIAVMEKKTRAADFVITAEFSVESSNDCIGGIWLVGKEPKVNGVVFGVQPNLHQRRLFNVGAANGADLVQPFAFIGGVSWERVSETKQIRSYSISSDGVAWTQIFNEPSNVRTLRYGLAVENRNGAPAAPDCELKVYRFQEEKP